MNQIIHISYGIGYQYKSITFEFHRVCGPTFLRRCDHEMKNEQSNSRDNAMLNQWLTLSLEERENYRIY